MAPRGWPVSGRAAAFLTGAYDLAGARREVPRRRSTPGRMRKAAFRRSACRMKAIEIGTDELALVDLCGGSVLAAFHHLASGGRGPRPRPARCPRAGRPGCRSCRRRDLLAAAAVKKTHVNADHCRCAILADDGFARLRAGRHAASWLTELPTNSPRSEVTPSIRTLISTRLFRAFRVRRAVQ
jgi:hypothetical protein